MTVIFLNKKWNIFFGSGRCAIESDAFRPAREQTLVNLVDCANKNSREKKQLSFLGKTRLKNQSLTCKKKKRRKKESSVHLAHVHALSGASFHCRTRIARHARPQKVPISLQRLLNPFRPDFDGTRKKGIRACSDSISDSTKRGRD